MKHYLAIGFGEFLGTFILVFFGTSIVAVSVVFQAPVGQVQVALVWGAGVTLAIYTSRHLSCEHLNPAVSIGMILAGWMQPRLLIPCWFSQLTGSAFAGCCVFLIFHPAIPGPNGGFFWVYIFAPLVGGSIAAGCFRFIIAPMMAAKIATMACECSAETALNGSRENRGGNCQP